MNSPDTDPGSPVGTHQSQSSADIARWTRLLSGALLLQLAMALWALCGANGDNAPVVALALALAAPISGLVFEVFVSRQWRCMRWSTGALALLWVGQMALLAVWHDCRPIAGPLIGAFGSAILLFFLCPLLIWPLTPHR